MDILLWTLLGAFAGFVASFYKNRSMQSVWTDVSMGVAGSVLGGLIMMLFGKPGVSGFSLYSAVVAVLGSVVLIGTSRRVKEKIL